MSSLTRDFETLEIKDQLFEEYKLLEERPQPPQVVDIRDEPKGEALAKKYQAKELLENWPFLSSGMYVKLSATMILYRFHLR